MGTQASLHSQSEAAPGSSRDRWTVEQARMCLEALGFLVQDLPQPRLRKHAELRATCECDDYVIRAVPRIPDGGWLERHEAIDEFGQRSIDRELRPLFAERIREAERQLASTPAAADAIRLAWFGADGDDEYALRCVEACLLGTRHVPFAGGSIDVYGFAYSELWRCTDLDAAVLANASGLRLVVNPYSENLERVRESSLYLELAARGAVVDAALEVAEGRALMIGSDFVGQRDGRAQWSYLLGKYGASFSIAS